MATNPVHLPNSEFTFYKHQLMDLGFSHKEAKILLKYISKRRETIFKYKSIHFADIYHGCFDFFVFGKSKRSQNLLVYKILNKWKNKKNHRVEYADFFYLYDKLSSLGKFMNPTGYYEDGEDSEDIYWIDTMEEIQVDEIFITQMLSVYYHEKENENDDLLIFKRFIDYHRYICKNRSHELHFRQGIKEFYRRKELWSIFLTAHNDIRNIHFQLPKELLDNIHTKLFVL